LLVAMSAKYSVSHATMRSRQSIIIRLFNTTHSADSNSTAQINIRQGASDIKQLLDSKFIES